MRKHYTILPIILSLFSILFAGAPDTLWTKTYGDDNAEAIGNSVKQTNDSGFVIVGNFISYGNMNGWDAWMIRTDPKGDTLWTKTYGDLEEDGGSAVEQTTDGDFIIAGYTESMNLSCDVYLIRTNGSGDTLWQKNYGNDYADYGWSVQQIIDGGFIIAGKTNNFGGKGDVYFIRTTEIGGIFWIKTFGGLENDAGYSIRQTNDNGFVIAGNTFSYGSGGYDIYLVRTDPNGDTLWTKTYGGQEEDLGTSVQQTSDGGFVITGSTKSFGAGEEDVYLIRTDSIGDTLWTKCYGGSEYDGGKSVQQTSDMGYIISGTTESFGNGLRDVFLVRTDANGNILWTKTLGGIEDDWGDEVQQTIDGGYIVTGTTESFGDGIRKVYLIRLDKDTTGIQQDIHSNFIKQNDLIVSYNNRNISIRYIIPYPTSVKLEAYDIKGKLVNIIADKFMHKGSHSVNWDSERFGAGVYFARLSTSGSEVVRKVTVVR